MKNDDSQLPDAAALTQELSRQINALAPEKSLCPSDIARALVGADPDRWSRLMPSIRKAAIEMAKGGQLVILRKGKIADPDGFKGVYRLAAPRQD
jgi:hypothetical protein